MGQKVNPVGLRIGIYRNWNSRWFAEKKDYATFLNEDLKIRAYLDKTLKDALLSHTEIERVKTDKGTNVTVIVYVARPGVVIGQDGARINQIKKELEKVVNSGTLKIDVLEVKSPDLNARLVALSIAKQLEERASFRIAQKKAIQRVRKAGAKGVRTLVSGRLGGAEIARSEGYKEGTIPLHTLRSDIDYAQVEAHTTYGRLGVKVWICRGDYRPETEAPREKGE
ncbi:MAG TPA: 30S ribosomal protein S3 [Bacilli bacterium]|jgi:small subunit ribosomal protein S3|nr:30S ribosomal protein S3 [Bacilli bacterium]